MAASAVTQPASYQHFPPHTYSSTPKITNSPGSSRKLPVFTSIKSTSHDDRGALFGRSATSSRQRALRSTLRDIDTKGAATTAVSGTSNSAANRPESQHARLHKRGGSSTSLPGSPAPSQFITPYATYEEQPFPDISAIPPNSTPKIKPYLRKMSSVTRDDAEQGRLDLSKSVSENEALAGLGIQDYGVSSGRRAAHTRTTSVNSQVSTASSSFRPTQPFIHPMRQVPNRTYTPDASSLNDEETRESSDVVPEEDSQPGQGLRRGRSMSLSSTAQIIAPTPLSQAHTAAELRYVPRLTSRSQSNLSIKSTRSIQSLKSKVASSGRPRAETTRSFEYMATSSSRTSLDKTYSRRSDAMDREERIRAARRKFEEKEADKDRKLEQRQQTESEKNAKKQERQRRRSEASLMGEQQQQQRRPRVSQTSSHGSKMREELRAMRYDDDSQVTALPPPTHGLEPGKSEKVERASTAKRESSPGGFTRFSAWFQTRMLSCGRKRS